MGKAFADELWRDRLRLARPRMLVFARGAAWRATFGKTFPWPPGLSRGTVSRSHRPVAPESRALPRRVVYRFFTCRPQKDRRHSLDGSATLWQSPRGCDASVRTCASTSRGEETGLAAQ